MPQPETQVSEQQQLQDKVWTFAQRGVILLVAMGAGLFIGYQKWGEADQLRERVTELQDRVTMREKERDTLKSQMAIVDRDKKELEKNFQDLQARCGTQEKQAGR
ncbi:MAG: hypothetical protein HY270_00810 [Deltaproteobacteria bacterium]|nr:hypothetical protein [Deltaproteobacteria bacterium]